MVFLLFVLIAWCADARAAEVNVGPGRPLKTLQAGVAAANANDRVVLDAGVYLDDVATIDKPLTIEGAGRGAVLRITKPISNRKGILVVNADLTVRKITFEGAQVSDADGKNGAGIRHQAGRMVVDTCVFNTNQNGILANGNKDATILIRRSAFSGNGAGDGYTHAIYINAIASLTVSDSTFAGTKVGHNIKSRAYKTTITNTILDDGVSGTPSYAIDLPNGGDVVLKGVRITQGQRTSNSSMVAFGAEKSLHENSSLTITGSTFINRAQNATAVNNFTPITATLNDNTFQNVGEITRGLVRMNRVSAPLIREGAIFSSLDPNAQSYLRFHNTGTDAGSVAVRLQDSRDGRYIGTWVSPAIPPNAAPQYSISILETALGVVDRPPSYSIVIEPAMTGAFQHVLHRAASGVLTNLSTCSAGVTRAGPQVANVHTSNLDNGYPATVVIQNQGPIPASAQIGIYDARQGQRVGSYTSAEVPVDGELAVRMTTIEAAARVAPAWDMAHWVLKIENEFSGTLQQLIANQRAGVVTDMTTVCALSGVDHEPESTVGIGAIFPAAPDIESGLLVHNTSGVAAPIRVTLFEAASGSRLAQWESPSIAANTSRQYAISSILPAVAGATGPRFYRINVESGFSGFVQHVIRHGASGGVSNLSSCDGGTTATLTDLAAIRASASEGADVALIALSNSGVEEAPAGIDVFNAADGRALGSFTTQPVPPGGSVTLSVVDIETLLGVDRDSGIGAYNVKLRGGFSGFMQYLLVNPYSGAVADMTTACAVGPVSYQ